MKSFAMIIIVCVIAAVSASAQSKPGTLEAHVAAAKAAAGNDYLGLFDRLCVEPRPSTGFRQQTQARAAPARSQWHAEPLKVFDNLYFVGQKDITAWAVTTSDGIILMDTIYDYSVEDEIVGGLTKLGVDPKQIKYAIVSTANSDHAGGAKFLQDHFGTRIILSAPDWDLLASDTSSWPKPKRDMVATDGQKLTLGDTTLTLYLTPGHTPGTLSTLVPVKDSGKAHLAAEWGGTAFNWPASYITAERPRRFWFETYSASAERFRDIAAKAGADVLIASHSSYDGSTSKLPALEKRKPGGPNPYIVGNESVQRYLTVADECAKAGLLRLEPTP
jgi:metallo-beta-lactamase class B